MLMMRLRGGREAVARAQGEDPPSPMFVLAADMGISEQEPTGRSLRKHPRPAAPEEVRKRSCDLFLPLVAGGGCRGQPRSCGKIRA